MDSTFADIIDHLENLLEGSVSGLDRGFPSGRLENANVPIAWAYPNSVKAPYPFYIPITSLSGDIATSWPVRSCYEKVHHHGMLVVQIGYAADTEDSRATREIILKDIAEIQKTVEDQSSWTTVTSHNKTEVIDWSIEEMELQGSDNTDDIILMYGVNLSIGFDYEEDYT